MDKIDDSKLREILKREQPKAGDNPWFTRKVMNRLPEKKEKFNWIENLIYILCGVICVLCWKWFIEDLNLSAITVGELLKYIILISSTMFLIGASIKKWLFSD